jgi:hypothetical protein
MEKQMLRIVIFYRKMTGEKKSLAAAFRGNVFGWQQGKPPWSARHQEQAGDDALLSWL